jgi:hypothetical protein
MKLCHPQKKITMQKLGMTHSYDVRKTLLLKQKLWEGEAIPELAF